MSGGLWREIWYWYPRRCAICSPKCLWRTRILKKFQSRSALLTLLVVGFVSLFAVGCGDSENFVFTGTNNTPITGDTGNLVFRFTQAQTVDTVPTGTTSLRFDFFSSDTPSLATFLFTETRSYAELIIIEDVPVETQSVVVTAFGANGQPLAVLTGDVNVIIGGDSEVDLVFNSNPTFNSITLSPNPAIILTPGSNTQQVSVTANFDTAQVLGQQTNYNVNIDPTTVDFDITENGSGFDPTANITASGLVTAIGFQQNATLTAEYTAFNTTRTDSTLIRTVDFTASNDSGPTSYNPGSPFTGWYLVRFFESDGITVLNVNEGANTTYALANNAAGVTVDPATGTFTTTENVTSGDIQIQVTWVDGRTQNADGSGGTGTTFTDVITFPEAE